MYLKYWYVIGFLLNDDKKELDKEKKEEKKKQIAWRNAIRLFEENQASINLRYMLFGDRRKPEDNPPWYAEFLNIVVLCLRTAYVNAYGYDNLTTQLYFELSKRLSGISRIENPDDFKKNKEKLDKLLEHLPGEFPEYEAISGLVNTGTGRPLTIEEFNGLLDYLNSEQCERDSIDALSEGI